MNPVWIIAALWTVPALAGEVEVSAARLVAADGHIQASDVTLRWTERDWQATAETAVFSDDVWMLQDGDLAVEDSFRVRFDRAIVQSDGVIALEGTRFSPCPCEGLEPWAVRARQAEWTPGERVKLRGGWVEVLNVPLIPVPAASIPLKRTSGFLAPTVGSGQDGLQVTQPLYVTLGPHADTTLSPEWRQERGVRGLGEFRWATVGGRGTVEAAAGPDVSEGRWRGGGNWALSEARGRTQLAARGLVRSDDTYLSDFGGTWPTRGLSWTQQRLLLGVGPMEAGVDLYQSLAVTTQRADWVARQPLTAGVGGVLAGAELGGAWTWQAADPWQTGPGAGLGWSRVQVERPTFLGPMRVDPTFGAEGTWTALDGLGGAVLPGLGVALPAWHRTKSGLERLEAGWQVDARADGTATVARTGPSLSYRRMDSSGVLTLNGRSWWDGTEVGLSADTQLQRGIWQLRGQADRDLSDWTLAAASAGVNSEPFSMDVGWITAPGGLLGQPEVRLDQLSSSMRVTLPLTRSTVKLGPDLRWDRVDTQWIRRAGQVGWTHPTGCTALQFLAAWDVDRAAPDVAVKLVLSPVSR